MTLAYDDKDQFFQIDLFVVLMTPTCDIDYDTFFQLDQFVVIAVPSNKVTFYQKEKCIL